MSFISLWAKEALSRSCLGSCCPCLGSKSRSPEEENPGASAQANSTYGAVDKGKSALLHQRASTQQPGRPQQSGVDHQPPEIIPAAIEAISANGMSQQGQNGTNEIDTEFVLVNVVVDDRSPNSSPVTDKVEKTKSSWWPWSS